MSNVGLRLCLKTSMSNVGLSGRILFHIYRTSEKKIIKINKSCQENDFK